MFKYVDACVFYESPFELGKNNIFFYEKAFSQVENKFSTI